MLYLGLTAINSEQPFFIYYVPGAMHAPHDPTPEWIKKISDMHLFDEGWNKLRDTIFANQKRLGVLPQDAKLTPWPDLLKRWDQLTDEEKKLFVRQADVFAAYWAYSDHEIGRGRHAERGRFAQWRRASNRSSDEVLRRLGLGSDLRTHGGAMDVGVRHAVLLDQAD
jgi:hypothetical protein